MLVDADGPVCRCGNRGCLETVAGTRRAAELLRRSHGDGLDGREIVRLARGGDLGCRRVIADAGRAIGKAVAMLVNVLNPELLIVGGDLADAGELLLDGVRESLARSALPRPREAATSSPVRSATAPRYSAPSRSSSPRPSATTHFAPSVETR